MKKHICLFVFSCLIFAGCSTDRGPQLQSQLLKASDHSAQQLHIHDKSITVELVNSDASTEQGLSGRTQIPHDGMLFVFPQSGIQRFWMKEMLFNLDFIWLKDLKVVDLTRNVPKPNPGQPLYTLPVYSPNTPANGVMEVMPGSIDEWQIKVGDTFF